MKKNEAQEIFKAIQQQADIEPAPAAAPIAPPSDTAGEKMAVPVTTSSYAGYGYEFKREPKSERFSFVMRPGTMAALDNLVEENDTLRNVLVHALIDAYILNYEKIQPYVKAVLETEPRAHRKKKKRR